MGVLVPYHSLVSADVNGYNTLNSEYGNISCSGTYNNHYHEAHIIPFVTNIAQSGHYEVFLITTSVATAIGLSGGSTSWANYPPSFVTLVLSNTNESYRLMLAQVYGEGSFSYIIQTRTIGTTVTINGREYYGDVLYIGNAERGAYLPQSSSGIFSMSVIETVEDLYSQITIAPIGGYSYPITYYPTNVTLSPAPAEAAVGDIVTVGVSVPAGYTLRDPSSSSIVVRNNGVIVPHTWDASSNQFTFIMPDPS